VSDFEADFEYLEDEELSANPAVNNIVSSYGTSTYGGLSIPELASSNFNGQILRVIDAQTATQATLGMSLYLNSSNIPLAPPTSTPLDSDIAYQIVEKTTLSGNTTFSVIKDGAVLQLDPIPSGNNIYLLRENWSGTTNFGDSGWAITAEGNSVFNNVRVRGNIEATSGFFGSDSSNGWNIGSSSLFGQSTKNKLSAYDPSFEDTWENYWTLTSTNASLTQNSSTKQDGLYSASITATSSTTHTYSFKTSILDIVASSGDHMLSFYASSFASHTQTVVVSYYNSADSLISSTSGLSASITGTFSRKTVSLSIPANTAKVEITLSLSSPSIFVPSGSSLLLLDAIQLEAGTSATTFGISSYIGLVPTEDIKIRVSSSPTSTPVFSVNSSGSIVTSGITSSGNVSSSRIRATSTSSLSTTSNNHALQLGSSSGLNMRFDLNDIQVLNNGSPTALVLNGLGGNVSVAPSGSARFGGSSGSTYPVEVSGTVNATAIRVSSTTRVDNLNAQYLNGNIAADFFRLEDNETVTGTPVFSGNLRSGAAYSLNISSSTSERVLYVGGADFNNIFGTLSSTERVKQQIINAEDEILGSRFLELEAVKYKYNQAVEAMGDEAPFYYGFIAENAEELGLRFLYGVDEDGLPDYFAHEKMPVYLFAFIKEQQKRIGLLEERLAILEG
jgi:hypothetical protein